MICAGWFEFACAEQSVAMRLSRSVERVLPLRTFWVYVVDASVLLKMVVLLRERD